MEIVYWAVNVIYSFHYFHHFICIEFILTTRSSKCWKNARVIVMAQWNGSWIWHNIFLINCIWRGVALSRPSEQDKISFAGKCRIQGVNNQLAVTTGGDLNDNNPTGPLLNHAPLSMTGIFPPKSVLLQAGWWPAVGDWFSQPPCIFLRVLCQLSLEESKRRGVTIIEWQLVESRGAPCMAPHNGDNCELSIIGTHRVLGSAQYLSSSPRDCHHTALNRWRSVHSGHC